MDVWKLIKLNPIHGVYRITGITNNQIQQINLKLWYSNKTVYNLPKNTRTTVQRQDYVNIHASVITMLSSFDNGELTL